MDAAQHTAIAAEPKPGYKDRFWIPRFWDGMCPSGWFSLLWRNRFAITPQCIAMAALVGSRQPAQFLSLADSGDPAGMEDSSHEDRRGPDFRRRTLALRHDPAARVARARSAAYVPRHLRLFCAEPFPGVGLVRAAVAAIPSAHPAADGQHAGRLGPPAGRRVRLVQHGRSVALSHTGLPQPPAAGSRVP